MLFHHKMFAVDLGTDNTIVHDPRKGIVFNEATCVAFSRRTGKTVCVGNEARRMQGKTPRELDVVFPLKDGAISHLDGAIRLLHELIGRFMKWGIVKPILVVSVPFDLSHIEKQAVREAGISAGAKAVLTVADPFSAAVGAGIDILSPNGAAIMDVGSGVAEISLLSCGEVVYSHSVRIAGKAMEDEIIKYLYATHRLRISQEGAEMLKLMLSQSGDGYAEVNAKNYRSGRLEKVRISLDEIRRALMPPVEKIGNLVHRFISAMPPAFAPSIQDNGLYLTGGSARLNGLSQMIERDFSLRTTLAKEPLYEVALGAGRIVGDPHLRDTFIR